MYVRVNIASNVNVCVSHDACIYVCIVSGACLYVLYLMCVCMCPSDLMYVQYYMHVCTTVIAMRSLSSAQVELNSIGCGALSDRLATSDCTDSHATTLPTPPLT